ncbi:hypothetical protein SRHO_G00080890 [Serrasalmus rhombeus]
MKRKKKRGKKERKKERKKPPSAAARERGPRRETPLRWCPGDVNPEGFAESINGTGQEINSPPSSYVYLQKRILRGNYGSSCVQ